MPDAQSLCDAQFRLIGHLDLGDQTTGCRVPTGEVDAGSLTDQTASAVKPDEIFRPQASAIRQIDVHADVVLHEASYLALAIDRNFQLADPFSQYPLDPVLPQDRVRKDAG